MDRSKYTDECLDILQNKQFTLLKHDAAKSIENKIRQELRKLKTKNQNRLEMQKYCQL